MKKNNDKIEYIYKDYKEWQKLVKDRQMEGEFSDYNRIFYQKDNRYNEGSLLLVSTKRQVFKRFNLENKQLIELDIDVRQECHQVEYYDKQLFCINRDTLSIDTYSETNKRKFVHRKTFFVNQELNLQEDFRFLIWSHLEKKVLYRCLLGPLEDGRYMGFDLWKKYFDYRTDTEIPIENVFMVKIGIDSLNDKGDVFVGTMDESKQSIICYNERIKNFFEFNDFSGKESLFMDVMNRERVARFKLRSMQIYYAYDFLSDKSKKQLQAAIRKRKNVENLENFVRDMYTEVLLCTEEGLLMKMSLVEEAVLVDMGLVWKITAIESTGVDIPIDIAVNEQTGEIYCLCKQGIRILVNSGRDALEKKLEKNDSMRKRMHIDENADS